MPSGLRESKKLQTRQLIAAEAMRLFVARGFDHVTVAEVAAAAGVSEKTVFNYFPSKEDLFFDEAPARFAALANAIRDRDAGESVIRVCHREQARQCARMSSPQFAVFARVIEDSPALQAKELELMGRLTSELASAIRDGGTPEFEATVAANAMVGVYWQFFRDARRQALAGRHGPNAARRLREGLGRAYALLEGGLAGL